jgi:aldehyde dehydrogenase (NAD+)
MRARFVDPCSTPPHASGKPLAIALAVDVAMTVKCYRYYAGWADGKIQGRTIPIEGNLFFSSFVACVCNIILVCKSSFVSYFRQLHVLHSPRARGRGRPDHPVELPPSHAGTFVVPRADPQAWKLGPALATGCTVVMKSSEKTPLTALMVPTPSLRANCRSAS